MWYETYNIIFEISSILYPFHVDATRGLYNEQYKIFSEFNNLANSTYNSNLSDLEFEQVHILRNILAQSSSLSPVQKHDILFKFANTLNDENNFTYCQELAKRFLKGINSKKFPRFNNNFIPLFSGES